ncbi:MAG: DUF3261 domain-containing protein [Myxococcales bacterium]|nr:DUF3261 domain-containing protein [Myxococcales bacterium]
MRRSVLRRAFVAALVVGGLGCAPLTRTFLARTGPECAGPLLSSDRVPEGIAGIVTARWLRGGKDQRARYGFESSDGQLVLVGLRGPGTKSFTVAQRGLRLDTQITLGGDLIHPEAVLREIQRAYFAALSETPLSDGEHRGTIGEMSIVETWSGGELRVRRFDAPRVSIHYGGDRVRVENETCGYEAELRASFSRASPDEKEAM